MSPFRSTLIRRVVAVLFLLTGLVSQMQMVFACELMDGPPRTVCCCGDPITDGCEMGGGCKIHDGVRTNADCCDVSIDRVSDVSAAGAVSPGSKISLLDAPQPPPFGLSSPVPETVPVANVATLAPTIPSWYSSGTHTYLVTNRLRI